MKVLKRLQCAAAISAARFIGFFCRLFGYEGVTFSGKAALKICPDLLQILAGQVREKIIVVCGTNGKTTTNNILCAALEAEGKKVICNHTGSNMRNGVAAAFALGAAFSGKLDADFACIEVDEASTRHVFPALRPDIMVVTNLFRDQLDRYGEIDITMEILESMIRSQPQMKLAVNGDDPLCAFLAMDSQNEYVTYGISEPVAAGSAGEMREGRFCKKCGGRLRYSFYHFSQLGDYSCPSCGFHRIPPVYDACDVTLEGGISFSAGTGSHSGGMVRFKSGLSGFYNVYNILAAWAGVREAGLEGRHFARMISTFHQENGRDESFMINGAKVTLNLAKNPAGFNRNIAEVLRDRSDKDIMILINDNDQDGRDISWLWDVDFDSLADHSVSSLSVGGIRGQDMRLRLKYTDIACDLFENEEKEIERITKDGTGNLYILVNYTALHTTRELLKKKEKAHR